MRRIMPYFIRDSLHSQIEAWAIVGLRLGATTFGLAAHPGRWKRPPAWSPHLYLTLWSPAIGSDGGRRWAFRLHFGRHSFGYRTAGDPEILPARGGFLIGRP